MPNPKIILLGGYGTFGRLIAEQLAQPGVRLMIAARDPVKGEAYARSLNAEFVCCDATNLASLRETIAGAFLVINASGPFQAKDYSIPETCSEQVCHYIDLGDGREYVAEISQLDETAKAHGVFICVGASTTPAITSAAVVELRQRMPKIRSIKVSLNAGNRNPAGVSTIASILAYVGRPVRVWQNRQWREISGWGLGEFIHFPEPVGRRRVQLCDVPDLELFPGLFDADNVVFKAGIELTLFNYMIGGLGQVLRLLPSLNLPALARLLVTMSKHFKSFGTLHGSFGVWVTSDDGVERSLAIVAPQDGPRVPASPAVLLARKLLGGAISERGAFPCLGFVGLAEFVEHLSQFGIHVVRGENGKWL